jgi:putative ABC transport system permease protein
MTSGGYFRAMGIPLLSGRVFTAADDSLSPRVVIINAAMARRFWPGQSALGRTMHFAGDTAPVTVIGIVGDVRETSLDEVADPQMFFSIHDQTPDHVALVARGALDDRALLARMTEAVHSVDRTQAVFNVRTMDEVLGTAVAPRRTNTVLIALFGALALLLAALGVYAVVSYGVTQRRRELGIRAALGATGADLVTLVAREMTWVVMLGVIIGLMVAWLFSRLIASQLYDVAAHDPAIFALAAVALIVPAAAATLVPALRATQVDPAMVMKAE